MVKEVKVARVEKVEKHLLPNVHLSQGPPEQDFSFLWVVFIVS